MRFRELFIKNEYRSFTDDIVKNFYIPLLDKAVLYQRAVGFFSSTSLIEISYGISKFLENNGHIQLIASPHLQESDIVAIEKGYEERKEVIERVLVNAITEPKNYFEEQRLNLLANLIAQNRLDIKIALLDNNGSVGMYHEKIGLIYDKYDDIVAFSGSMNETKTALSHNYETIDVFCSWTKDVERVKAKKEAFITLWNNEMLKMDIIEFPQVARDKLISYKKSYIDLDIDKKEYSEIMAMENNALYVIKDSAQIMKEPRKPYGFKFHDYQEAAINEWEKQKYVGIFDMATGTGKTYTGLGALTRLSEALNNELAVIIVCPYQHLVEQWVEDIVKFNISPIVGYSNSVQRDWKQRLIDAIRDLKLKVKGGQFFCFISTNATFASEFVQSQINKIRGNVLLMVDEAHNFGSSRLSSLLSSKFNYRLALSATLERHNDEEGTVKLTEYFGSKCIEYPLERAIKEKKLTPYKYYPVLVHLDEAELEMYSWLSQEINKCIIVDKNGKKKLNEKGERLALKRARVVAAAKSKIDTLKHLIQPYIKESYILIYCGAASLLNENEDYSSIDEEDIRQIDAVTGMLGNELEMKVSQFTSRENVEEREILKQQFEQGDNLQALIAIKCLDEGVNIPKIKTAFILASTTNPKEYIQRRGRVLRLATGKDYAEIFDFITIPRPLDEVSSLTVENMRKDLSLVRNEITRAEEFARMAMNAMEADSVIQEIKEAYFLNEDNMEFL